MIHVDTHVVIWMYGGELSRLSAGARRMVEAEDLAVSPMVAFELGILYELGRLGESAAVVLDELRRTVGLDVDDRGFESVARMAMSAKFAFTRDPFDRFIAAHADVANVDLLTKDRKLRNNLDFAIWP